MNTALNYQPEVLVDTADLSREDWLDYRRLGIGGSDAAAIMGLSPFATIRDLYFDKIGVTPVIEEEEENWVAKEVGHRLEDLVAMIFAKKTGLEVFPVRKMFRHPLYPFMLADVDYFIRFPDGSIGILECKTCNYNAKDKWADDGIPENYVLQVRHYLAVMNMNKACLLSTDVCMGRKFSGSVYSTAGMIILNHAKYFLEIRILAGIGFYAFLSSLMNQPVRNIFTGMEYTGTAVVCLFLMLGTAEYPVNKSYHRFSINRCPSSVISSVMCIHFFVI